VLLTFGAALGLTAVSPYPWAGISARGLAVLSATYAALVTVASYSAGSIVIKTLITPEWWTLAPLPVGFVLLGIEFIFRMHRLAVAEIGLRDDAVSAA